MTIDIRNLDDQRLEDRIRRTLRAVAATVEDPATDGADNPREGAPAASTSFEPPTSGRTWRGHRRARRVLAIAAACLVLGLGFVGWKQLREGDIERIPTEAALMHGSADGYDWWLIPSLAIGHTNPCGVPMPGVEMVSAVLNRQGEQWSTGGVNYGLHSPNGTRSAVDDRSGVFTYDCTNPQSDFDEAAWSSDPALHDFGFMRLGRGDDPNSPWGGFVAVHPTVDEIDVVVDGRTMDTVRTAPQIDRPDGPRYAGFTFASDTCDLEVHYRVGNQVVTTDRRELC